MGGIDRQQYQQIIDAARYRNVVAGVDTMVAAAHLAQMRLFMVRQGLEFYASQDSFAQRREFLRRVVEYNQLASRLDAIIDAWLCDGRGLWFFRPSRDLYRIHFFDASQYRAYYDEDGLIEELEIAYPFSVRPNRGNGMVATTGNVTRIGGPRSQTEGSEQRWVYMRYRADRIEQKIVQQKPEFGERLQYDRELQTVVNTLGFVPAVEVFNNRGLGAGTGAGEFDGVAGYIVQHNKMLRNIRENLDFFGNPTLVSSRPKHDLMEQDGGSQGPRPTVSSKSGFGGIAIGSTKASMPTGSEGMFGLRMPRVIANVEAADRVGFIQVDPVPGDLLNHAQMYQEMIRASLGGVDDLSISSGATAYEVRTLYGRVSATARRKNRDLLEFGLCQLLSLMIQHEERLFRESLAVAGGIKKPDPVLAEDLPPQQREAALRAYDAKQQDWRGKIDALVKQVIESGEVPPQVVGLIPDGNTRVEYRWQGEVFPDSPQELLQNSIVCRNLQELGVGSIEAISHLFPSKTPEERKAMLSGYPFRMVEATQRSLGIFADMIRALFQVPHPQEPDLPLAADPGLDLVPYLYKTLDYLRGELSYSGSYFDVDPAVLPTVLSDADRVRASIGRTTELERTRSERRERFSGPWNPGAAGLLAAGAAGNGAMAGVVQPAGRVPDTEQPLPGMGGTLSYDPAGVFSGPGSQLGSVFPSSGPVGGTGSPDLAAPSNAGLAFGSGRPVPGQPGSGPANGRRRTAGTGAGNRR